MKSGFVAILGRPNVGKSTILNDILNEKISIVTDKSQTTRNNIRGIYNCLEAQIVFVDTPGIHKPHQTLGERMNNYAYSSAHDVDINVLVIDASAIFGNGDQYLIEHLDLHNAPLILVFNKIDRAKITHVTDLKNHYIELFPNATIIETVALDKFNIDELIKKVIELLPEGVPFYPTDVVTDKDEIFQIKEIIREKVLRTLKEEVPHAVAIYLQSVEWDDNPIHIKADIIVEKDSQKGIVIGAQGKRIKLIGSRARQDIESLLHKHVFLELFVKVQKDWRNEKKSLETYGYKSEK